MARGQYLRTNYRITGGLQDITAIGAGWGQSPANVGAALGSGAFPRDGFIYITSYCTSVGGSTKNVAWTNWIYDSTAGILSWYYTSLSPGAGYKFLPLGWRIRSVSDTKIGSIHDSYCPGVYYIPVFGSMTFSGSEFGIKFGKPSVQATTGSALCLVSYSGEEMLMDLWGFIVSSP